MSSSFFATKEYTTLVKIKERLGDKCTLKNVLLLLKYSALCYKLAKEEYGDVGWDGKAYRWDKWFYSATDESCISKISELLLKYGDDYNSMIKAL